MVTLKDLEKNKQKILKDLENINQEINKKLKKTIVLCTNNNYGKGCGMGMYINDLDYIQTHWYEEPYSCSSGDMWHQGEGNFICPHCNHRNRLYDRKEIEELQYLFKSIIEEHEK